MLNRGLRPSGHSIVAAQQPAEPVDHDDFTNAAASPTFDEFVTETLVRTLSMKMGVVLTKGSAQ